MALALAWLVVGGPARAGGGGSTGASSGSSGATETGSSDAGGQASDGSTDGSSTGAGSAGASSTDATGNDATGNDATSTSTGAASSADMTAGCDLCSPNAGRVTIVSPQDGDQVTSPLVVVVDVGDGCTCDGCTCSAEAAMYTQVFLNALAVDGPCYTSHCEFNVFPTRGTHNIYVAATFTDTTNFTDINVHVTAVDDSTTEGGGIDPTTASDASSTTGPAEEAGTGGCGCDTTPRGGVLPLFVLGLLALGPRRRPSG